MARGADLLVGEDKQDGVSELILIQHAVELIASLSSTVPVVLRPEKHGAVRK